MTNLPIAVGVNSVVIGLGYVIGVLLIIALVCFGVVKLFGGTPRTRWHQRGEVGEGAEQIVPTTELRTPSTPSGPSASVGDLNLLHDLGVSPGG